MKKLYEITEISRNKCERYCLKMTRDEVGKWCKMKRNAHGYVRGVGGDKSYDCFAVCVE